jgi:hypothetical protein
VKYRTYYYSFKNSQGKREIAKGFTDRAATLALAEKKQKDADRKRTGLTVEPRPEKSYQEALEEYIEELKRQGVRAVTSDRARAVLEKIARECQWQQLHQVTADTLTSWLTMRSKQGCGPRTQNYYHTRLNHFLRYCKRRGWL